MSDDLSDGAASRPDSARDGAQRTAEIVVLRGRRASDIADPIALRRAEHLLGLLRDRVRGRRMPGPAD